MYRNLYSTLLLSIAMVVLDGCQSDEGIDTPIKNATPSEQQIDKYIQTNFVDKYGVAVRYQYVDRYVDPDKSVTPPKQNVVQPMLDFLTGYWIKPFEGVPNGKVFFAEHVPAEIVFIGSTMYNSDGTVTLGTADAGARITLTEVNDINEANNAWVLRQLGTIYHEFAHIVHQRYNLPPNWQTISPQGYTSVGSWYVLTDEQALQRGFVSPYGTSSFNEDFAEFVAFLLFDKDFYTRYIEDEENCSSLDCQNRNTGRSMLRKKYEAVIAHYKQYTGVDLLQVRALVQDKIY